MTHDEFSPQALRDPRIETELFPKLRKVCATRLGNILQRVYSRTDEALYELSQKDETSFGSQNLEGLRMLRSLINPLEQAYLHHFEAGFDALQRRFDADAAIPSDLTLVQMEEMEDLVASELIADAMVRAFAPGLDMIDRRLARLVAQQTLPPGQNPISASSIAHGLRVGLEKLVLGANVRVLLFKNYERELIDQLGPMLDEVNTVLAAAGILPELGLPRPAPRPPAPRPPMSPSGSAVAGGDVTPAFPEGMMQAAEEDKALFDALVNMLHGWRPQQQSAGGGHGQGGGGSDGTGSQTPDANRRAMAKDEMISVLSLMQPQVPAAVQSAMNHPETSLSLLLKQEMLSGASRIGLDRDDIKMSRDDEDAVDLVGMLFDVLFDERDFEAQARTLISRLVVPYVKAAVMDRRLFQYKTHPARRLLNSLSEAVEGNKGEGPQERELLQKAEHTVDRLLAEFNEDIAIFETLEQELRSFLEQHRRRIELAERRATEAQRGQERLEQARTLASSELSSRVENVIVPDALTDFLSRIWSHHLSMIALREGPESVSWNAALGVADSLIGLLPREGHAPPAVATTIAGIRDPLETVLASSGIAGESANETIRVLSSSLEIAQKIAPVRPAAPKPESAPVEALHANLGQQVPATDGPAQANTVPFLSVAADKDRLDYNDEDIALLRGLKIGAWIDLAGEDEKLHPAKLSWVSPISSRLMFVNRRGVRVLVASIEELAAMKKVGRLAVREQDQVFDQAMHRVMGRLQSGEAG
jgi:hypothetical protein